MQAENVACPRRPPGVRAHVDAVTNRSDVWAQKAMQEMGAHLRDATRHPFADKPFWWVFGHARRNIGATS